MEVDHIASDVYTKTLGGFAQRGNHLIGLIGTFILGTGVYIIGTGYGSVALQAFLSVGLIIFLFGLLVLLLAILGNSAVEWQYERFSDEVVTPQRMIAVYQIVLLFLVIGELYVWSMITTWNEEFENTMRELESLKEPGVGEAEYDLATVFNKYFYFAASRCHSHDLWFWKLVNSHCPNKIDQLACQKCYEYSITTCFADEQQCDSGGLSSTACAYTACRYEVLEFIQDDFTHPFLIIVLVCACVQFLCLLLVMHVHVLGCRKARVMPVLEDIDQTAPPPKKKRKKRDKKVANDISVTPHPDNEFVGVVLTLSGRGEGGGKDGEVLF